MELKALVGKRTLDGVDFSNESIKSWGDRYEDCQVCRFRLDGNVYSAVEDPDDGYRSSMKELVVSENIQMKNEFKATEVLCRYKDSDGHGYQSDLLEIVDTTTGETILEVGTENTDDYYPYYVANFHPEAMATNAEERAE